LELFPSGIFSFNHTEYYYVACSEGESLLSIFIHRRGSKLRI